MGQTARRHLEHPVLGRQDRKAAGIGIHRPPLDNPAILAWFTAVEPTCLKSKPRVLDSDRGNVVSDMRGILPMVAQCSLRYLSGRRAVGKSDWAKRRVADRSVV